MQRSSQSRNVSSAWRFSSLRGRIAILAASVVILLTLTLCILVWVLRSTQTNTVHRSQRRIEAISHTLANAYEDRSIRSISLTQADRPFLPLPQHDKQSSQATDKQNGAAPASPLLQEPPPPPPGAPPPPGEPHALSPQEKALEALTARVLQDDVGIEGGFFRSVDQRLVGYAFPTHEGPGNPEALPARETPDILSIAHAAVVQRKEQEELFVGPHDVVLLVAVPVCETRSCAGGVVGSAWLMHRLHGAETERKRALLWVAFGFAVVACVTVLLAFLALQQVGHGTQAVLDRLTVMEANLSRHPHPSSVKLAEFHRVLDGLDGLGEKLREQMERERDLQGRLSQSERLAAIGQLAAGVAHELRNPLATIRLRAQMAQRKTHEEATEQSSSVILAEVDRLDAIIERLLDFSRPIRMKLSTVNVSDLAAGAVQSWHSRHPQIAVEYKGGQDICTVADADRLRQVLDNLLENAVHQLEEAKPEVPQVQVFCTKKENSVHLEIADNGGGFTLAGLQSATQPFFTTRARGTGLGLAITQEIVHALGGSLTLNNDADGARVRIQLPAN